MKQSSIRIVLVLLLVGLLASACNTFNVGGGIQGSGNVIQEDRDVSGFTGVQLNTSGDVTITAGEADALTIEAEDNIMPLLTSEVRGGVLQLGTTPNSSFSTTRGIHYIVTIASLESVELNGSGDINVADFSGDSFSITTNGSGDTTFAAVEVADVSITVNGSGAVELASLSGDTLQVRQTGSGDITVAGQVTSQDVEKPGSGSYHAFDLASATANINVSGSGDAEITVSEALNAQLSSSGNVIYAGEPAIEQSTTGSGDVRAR